MTRYQVTGGFSAVVEAADEDDARNTVAAGFDRISDIDFDDGSRMEWIEDRDADGTRVTMEVAEVKDDE